MVYQLPATPERVRAALAAAGAQEAHRELAGSAT
jgi:hypothetical protein